jgi:glycosyltransferase involved in cell wall biosynthesis
MSRLRGRGISRAKNGDLRLGFMGTIHRHKGLHVLLKAFERLPRDAGVTLRVCGDLTHFPEYVSEVYEMAHRDPRINFAGPYQNERVMEELKKMDVLVVPSIWYENTPLVIYEAFAAGISVVATDLGGMSEIVEHEKTGLLFEPGNPEDLARQLKRLIDEPDALSKYSGSVENVRPIEDSVDETLDLYARLLEKKAQEREQAVSEYSARNVEARDATDRNPS